MAEILYDAILANHLPAVMRSIAAHPGLVDHIYDSRNGRVGIYSSQNHRRAPGWKNSAAQNRKLRALIDADADPSGIRALAAKVKWKTCPMQILSFSSAMNSDSDDEGITDIPLLQLTVLICRHRV